MTVEELQQENEKLQGRLQKAISVFSEQKATIQKLTDENKQLSEQVEAYTVIKEKYAEAQTELDALHMKVEATEKLLATNEGLNNQKMETINNMLNERNELIEKQKGTIAELTKRVSEAADNDEKFFEQLEEINKLTENNKELDNKLNEANNRLEKAAESYKQQAATIENLNTEKAAVENQLAEANAKTVEMQSQITKSSQEAETVKAQAAKARESIQQMQRLGADLITNFDIFAM